MESLLRSEIVNRKHTIHGDVMNNEWTRFQSFINFPEDSVARPIRLAQAGFFYNGSKEEAICFCCGLRNDVWTEEETALEAHRRLSPHCRYVCSEDTTNVAINGENRLKIAPNSSKGSGFITEYGTSRSETQSKHSTSEKVESENDRGNFETFTQATEQSIENMHQNYDMRVTTVSTLTNGQTELYPGISCSRPEHSEYALISERRASFTGWPSEHVMDPTVLAKAGFYYAGLQDCVRCFFCSGGMKNWQYSDNPWIEHARWFPNCAYIKLCRGETFANICSAAINYDNVAIYDNESQLDQENIPDDWLIENINSAAAKIVLSMGYRQEDVEKGVMFAREKYGPTGLKAQYVIEYMQDTNKESYKQQLSVGGNNNMSKYVNRSEEKHIFPNTTGNMKEKHVQRRTDSSESKPEMLRLREENRKLKDLITCKICLNNDACVAFLPCGHLASCVECSKSLKKCAICRKKVQATVRVYQA